MASSPHICRPAVAGAALLAAGLALGCSAAEPTGGAVTPPRPVTSSPVQPPGGGPAAAAPVAATAAAADGGVAPQPPEAGAEVPPEGGAAAADPCAAVPNGMACVPAGPFIRGMDDDPHRCVQGGQPLNRKPASVPAAKIYLDAFFIDLYEVTFAEFRRCADAGACRNVRPLYFDFDRPRQPMMGVSWFDADAYCRFAGKRLPTEAEWEKAARGPDGEDNPFGNVAITCANAVVMNEAGRSCGVKKQGGKPDTGRVLEVGSRPAGRYGLYDMAGNAEEWVADWWTESYAACGDACLGANPEGPCGGGPKCPGYHWKVVKGGSWYWPAEHASGYHRRRHFPQNDYPHYHHFGFRCAADAKQPAGGGPV